VALKRNPDTIPTELPNSGPDNANRFEL